MIYLSRVLTCGGRERGLLVTLSAGSGDFQRTNKSIGRRGSSLCARVCEYREYREERDDLRRSREWKERSNDSDRVGQPGDDDDEHSPPPSLKVHSSIVGRALHARNAENALTNGVSDGELSRAVGVCECYAARECSYERAGPSTTTGPASNISRCRARCESEFFGRDPR